MLVRARAPLRLGLAGGGTDVSPYCDLYGGYVLNATIDLYAHATLIPDPHGMITMTAADMGVTETFDKEREILAQGPLALHKAVYAHIVKNFNRNEPLPCRLTTYCDAPPGSGIGSSSTLVVAMVKAFSDLLSLPLGDYDLAQVSYEVERRDLGLLGGRQDQYAATFGGINFMEFYADNRVIVNPLRISSRMVCEIESSIVLCYTGVSRASDTIIKAQIENVIKNEGDAIGAMHDLKVHALEMKECILKGNVRGFGDGMRRSWAAKQRTAANITNADIDRMCDAALSSGAFAGKISGAGGGGFLLCMVDPLNRMKVIQALEQQNGKVIPCHLTKRGVESWRVE